MGRYDADDATPCQRESFDFESHLRKAPQGTQRSLRRRKAGLVSVTAFEPRRTMQPFVSQIAWESEAWIGKAPDHMIHFNGEQFLRPYPDVMRTNFASLGAK